MVAAQKHPLEKVVEDLEAQRDAAVRELRGVQEMLGLVLLSIGEEVTVSKDDMRDNALGKFQINIDDTPQAFVFRLVENG